MEGTLGQDMQLGLARERKTKLGCCWAMRAIGLKQFGPVEVGPL